METDDRKRPSHNSTYPKGGFSCSKVSFVVNQTLVFQIKFCGKNPAFWVAAKRCATFEQTPEIQINMTENLNNNPTNFEFRKFFLDYLEKVMNLAKNHPEYDINKNNYHLHSEDAKLALSILNFQTKLNDLVADLKKVEIFIRRFPNKRFYEENDIDQLDYIKYHYEVFIHKIHTILEVKKMAINTFYDIGLKEKDCLWKNLKNQKQIKSSAISKIIEFYYKSFEHIIKHRHLNTHRAYFGDKTNDELKTDYSIYRNAEKFGREVGEDFRRIMPRGFVNYKIKEYKKERIEYVKSGTEIAYTYVEQFQTTILTEFFNKIMNKNVAQYTVL